MGQVHNIVLIFASFLIALTAIYTLYAIIMAQGKKQTKGNELQLSTKNILEQVKILYDQKEYALAQLIATKYLDRVPNHQEVRQYLAKAYYEDGKYNHAIKQCFIILKKTPNHIETRKLLGDCFINKQLLNKAVKEYEKVYEQQNNNKEVAKTLAKLYRETGQIYSSIAVYNKLSNLTERKEEIAKIQLILAELNEEVQEYPAAFDACKIRLSIYPTDISTNQKLVELYIKINNPAKAVESLLHMLSFATEPQILLWIYEKLVEQYVVLEDFEQAIEFSNKILEIPGSDKFTVRNNIALYNIKLGNFDKGISVLEELVMMSQNGYDVTVELANAYIKRKEYNKALDKFLELLDQATQKEARDVRQLICNLYISWAEDFSESENYSEAFNKLDLAAEYNPENPEIYYTQAINHIKLKNDASAVELLLKALEFDKDSDNLAKYYIKLSEAHHNLGNFFEEKKALSDLLKIDETNPMGLYRSGLLYIGQHDSKNAEECFKKALQYNPKLIQAKYNLALIYESNNVEKARDLYMQILEQDPTYEEARTSLADLASSDYY